MTRGRVSLTMLQLRQSPEGPQEVLLAPPPYLLVITLTMLSAFTCRVWVGACWGLQKKLAIATITSWPGVPSCAGTSGGSSGVCQLHTWVLLQAYCWRG